MTSDSVEQKIIEAAIACVEEFGLKGATNRRIAEKAGVNLAAINYYFRSKDNLIDKMMETTLHNAFDWEDVDKLPGGSAKERCTSVFEELIAGACAYPGITRAHFYTLISAGDYESLAVIKYNEFINRLCDDLVQRGVKMTREELTLAVAQIASACFLATIAPQLHGKSLNLDMRDPATRHRFVSVMVDKLL
jgi:AcrR family transcriptional regulator